MTTGVITAELFLAWQAQGFVLDRRPPIPDIVILRISHTCN